MKFRLPVNINLVFYLLYLLLIGAVFARMIPHYVFSPNRGLVIGLLSVYLFLLLVERVIAHRFQKFIYIYFALELGIITWLFSIPNVSVPLDYYTNLAIPLAGQAIWELPMRSSRICVFIITVFCLSINIAAYGLSEGIGFGLTYVTGCLLVAILGAVTQKSERAHAKSQMLLSELQRVNRKLQDYAEQVEILAVTEARNRMARELHDSVSQTIFSMTLTAQSARILLEKDPTRVANLLDHLQSLSQSALSEMRTLIQEFREHAITENGFISALKNHAALRLTRDELNVDLQLDETLKFSETTGETLFRIAQEALNNIVKHAGTRNAFIELTREMAYACLTIRDHGKGFDMSAIKDRAGHVGFSSMEERAKELGAVLSIQSTPGQGTVVQIKQIPVIDNNSFNEATDEIVSLEDKNGA